MTGCPDDEVNLEELRRELQVMKDRQRAEAQKKRQADPYVVGAVIVAIIVIVANVIRLMSQ